MVPSSLNGVYLDGNSQVLWEDGERVFCRGLRLRDGANPSAVLVVLPATERPSPSSLDRLAHEYGLKDELDGTWAVQPLELVRDGGCTMLVLEDPGGEPLPGRPGAPAQRLYEQGSIGSGSEPHTRRALQVLASTERGSDPYGQLFRSGYTASGNVIANNS
jgi:hypothetical protein